MMCNSYIGLVILSIAVIVVVYRKLHCESKPTSERFTMFQPVPFASSIQLYNPKVQGVSLPNRTNIFKISALNAGMLDQGAIQAFFPANECEGETAYQLNKAVVYDTLELSPTLESERLSLANALAGTNYETPANRLWYQKNLVSQLNQPGLSDKLIQPQGVYSCF
jgi:hypothetical protein